MSEDPKNTIVTPVTKSQSAGMLWTPKEGAYTHSVKANLAAKGLPLSAIQQNIDKASSILGRGLEPHAQHSQQKTGLVVGYVQSGKTLSYTTVISMAKDNGFDLVIVVTGITKILLEQTTKRINQDLSIEDEKNYDQWFTFNFSTTQDVERDKRSIQNILEEWRDENSSGARKTILIPVLKNTKQLGKLLNLFQESNLVDVPTLIIDDEADQASLNHLVNQGKNSAIYQRLTQIREALPCNTFLQYTATPQAPLLINIFNLLSPDFVEVLDPGEDYVGGTTFFSDDKEKYVRKIPDDEIIVTDNELGEPPESLLSALYVYLIGVAAGLIEGRTPSNPNRSMLVHPAREISRHQEYKEWIINILDDWKELMFADEQEPDRKDLIDELMQSHADLSDTVKGLPDFEQIKAKLPSVFRNINIEVINQTTRATTPKIEWNKYYGWILIGGQVLERGYTVNGLTVTYMSRGSGIGNADTIQQRGRFFGYIRQFLGYCRIYLETTVLKAFVDYVKHEENVREQLCHHRDTGQSLDQLKRKFLLSSDLKPCRSSIIESPHTHYSFSNEWFRPQFVRVENNVIVDNQKLIREFLASYDFRSTKEGDEQHGSQIHQICESVSLQNILEKLLVPFSFSTEDTLEQTRITGLLFQLSKVRDLYPDEKCTVYKMSPNFERRRAVSQNGKIKQLFQGPLPAKPKALTGTTYSGDREYKEHDVLSVQIHSVHLTLENVIIANAVPILAIWVPERMKIDWYVQAE